MAIKAIQEVTCDYCDALVPPDDKYVNAMVYGVAFHVGCWVTIRGPLVARLLGLDDIYYYQGNERLDRAMESFKKRSR